MKKTLLLSLFLTFSVLIFAQFHKVPYKNNEKVKKAPGIIIHDKTTKLDLKPHKSNKKNNLDLARTEIGKSANAHSLNYPEQRRVFFDEKTQNILFTFPADPEEYPEALSEGSIASAFIDIDELKSWNIWTTQISINPDPELHSLYSPSGIIYNSQESNDVEETYTVIAGMDLVSDSWANNYFASVKLNNSEQNVLYNPMQSENDWARSSMTVIDNEVYIFGQDYTSMGDYATNQALKHYKGTTDDPISGFEWEINTVNPDWLINEDEGYAYALYTTYSAWKKDGSIGYMWMVGVTNESYNYGVYQPQVYYTTDKGDTWEYIHLDLENHPELVNFLPAWEDVNGDPQGVRPSFLTSDRTFPGSVDYRGYLNLYSNVYGSTTGDVLNPDEGNWVNDESRGGYIFDFVIKPEGLDNIFFIDSINTEIIVDTAFGNIGNTHCIQSSKTKNENTTFVLWIDDLDSDDGYLNNPDLFGVSHGHCPWGADDISFPVNFSENDLYQGFNFYPFVAEYSIDGDGYYEIIVPVTESVNPSEWASDDSETSITHNYVSGVFMPPTCVNEVEENNFDEQKFEVAQNVPNPVKDFTEIEVVYHQIAPVNIEVCNLLGQIIITQDMGLIYNEMSINLDLTDEDSGVYFYTIKIGDEKITKKMVLE